MNGSQFTDLHLNEFVYYLAVCAHRDGRVFIVLVVA